MASSKKCARRNSFVGIALTAFRGKFNTNFVESLGSIETDTISAMCRVLNFGEAHDSA